MKRLFLFAAVMILASMWARPAHAQFGMGMFGGSHDPIAEIDQQKSTINARTQKYTHAPSSHARISRPKLTNPASMDAYGRMDLAGHPVPGYPIVRGAISAAITPPSFLAVVPTAVPGVAGLPGENSTERDSPVPGDTPGGSLGLNHQMTLAISPSPRCPTHEKTNSCLHDADVSGRVSISIVGAVWP